MTADQSNSSSPPKKLYKYCPAERIDIVTNQCVRFTPADQFNDPFEFIISTKNVLSDDEIRQEMSADKFQSLVESELEAEIAKQIPPHVRDRLSSAQPKVLESKFQIVKAQLPAMTASLSSQMEALVPDLANTMMEMFSTAALKKRSDFGLLCLTEKFDNYAMWAHYADNHQGFVLEFDSEKLGFVPDVERKGLVWCPIKVKYLSEKVLDAKARGGAEADLLLSKHEDWAYEQEWRIMAPLEEVRSAPNYRGYELVGLKPGSITAIYLGSEFFSSGGLSAEQSYSIASSGIEVRIMEKRWAEARLRALTLAEAAARGPSAIEILIQKTKGIQLPPWLPT